MSSENNDHSFVKSSKGANLLVLNNYVHRKKATTSGTDYWVCICPNCKGKVNLKDGQIVGKTLHSHEPDTAKVIEYKQRNLVKTYAANGNYQTLRQTYQAATDEMIRSQENNRDEMASSLLTFNELKRAIVKQRSQSYPPLPITRSDIIVPEKLKVTSANESFLRVWTGEILIFATESFLTHQTSSDHVYSDGTFASVPRLFHSLYTFHVLKSGLMIPTVYALIPNASTSTYICLLRAIQDLCESAGLHWNPRYFTSDFEVAFHRALMTVFPSCSLKSCLFHYSQAIWRNVARHNLANRYMANEQDNLVKDTVKRISAMPFLKEDDIPTMFEQIKSFGPDDEDMLDFYDYVENTYIKVDARFPINTWNHFDNPDPRTNNHIEGWHAALNRSVGRAHANIWFYIEKLIQQQNNFEVKLMMAQHGARDGIKSTKYKRIDQRIKNLTTDYSNAQLSPFDFLNKVKYFTRLEEL